MDRARETAHLVMANRHIDAAMLRIARQEEIVAELDRRGLCTDAAKNLLELLQTTLDIARAASGTASALHNDKLSLLAVQLAKEAHIEPTD
jgi:hypothetical protein